MRIGIVRSDVGRIYLSDVENKSQRNFSSQPAGQSRYFHKPSTAELTTLLNAYAFLTKRGTDTSATVDTSTNNTLRIKVNAADSFTVITVTAGATTSKAIIANDLNNSFVNVGLPFISSVDSSNRVHIDTKSPNNGPTARLMLDSVGNGSTLNTALGFGAGTTTLTGLAVATLVAAVYPTATTIDVSNTTIDALSTFNLQTATQLATTESAIADAIAPKLVETGPALLSFAFGVLSKLTSSSFQPGGTRIGLPAGVAAAIVANDGSTVFTL